ncbi:hypothetical protein PghCCS26_46590 [Paenibacillus glycanilyticus]|uniref:HTH cro/C1-type domain-containing protein n=1 Tax=Paenibacillus glycanilyticus TaxID=126569 RepID=A0ABQ6NRX6_9BACL|nr:helix-turn-helix transcriptional regulator [Paenibacillus glycanilyticus]GMK47529.1 hypothetical protein PghCCS26_46590 [Paenibacillus glycanilyticus]
MTDLKKAVGERLKEARERKSFKQNQVAKVIGIHNSTLAKYESGEREADYETLIKLAELYEVTVDWITGNNEQLERLEPIIDVIGQESLEDFLDVIISYLVSKDHFIKEMNERHKQQCESNGIPFTPLTSDQIVAGYKKANINDKLNLSKFFSYLVDIEKNNVTVFPMIESSNEQKNITEYQRIYEELGFNDEPPKEDELRVMKIALQSYRMGKSHEKR